MENLYAFLSTLLWARNCSKTIKTFKKYRGFLGRQELEVWFGHMGDWNLELQDKLRQIHLCLCLSLRDWGLSRVWILYELVLFSLWKTGSLLPSAEDSCTLFHRATEAYQCFWICRSLLIWDWSPSGVRVGSCECGRGIKNCMFIFTNLWLKFIIFFKNECRQQSIEDMERPVALLLWWTLWCAAQIFIQEWGLLPQVLRKLWAECPQLSAFWRWPQPWKVISPCVTRFPGAASIRGSINTGICRAWPLLWFKTALDSFPFPSLLFPPPTPGTLSSHPPECQSPA